MHVLIFDTETTGLIKHSQVPLAQQPFIIELGVILWERPEPKARGNGNVTEASWLFHPGVKLDSVITKITGLTDHDLEGQPTFAEKANDVASMFAQADVAVAHNFEFDYRMVSNELTRCAFPHFPWPKMTMCTVRQYEHVFGHRPTLQQLYLHVLGTSLAQTHRALDDCRAVLEIMQHDRSILFPQ
jgi:DNA polymerase III epsilon subunit-like protein